MCVIHSLEGQRQFRVPHIVNTNPLQKHPYTLPWKCMQLRCMVTGTMCYFKSTFHIICSSYVTAVFSARNDTLGISKNEPMYYQPQGRHAILMIPYLNHIETYSWLVKTCYFRECSRQRSPLSPAPRVLTHLPPVPHICVNESSQHWFR